MATVWDILLHNLGVRVDEELLPRLYQSIGLRTADIRAELKAEYLAYHDPEAGQHPSQDELDAAAEEVIARAARTATVGGALAGFAGAAAIPPELGAALVQTLRLAQRLAVIYGHDPDTVRGQMVMVRAVAAAWELELPRQGMVDLRVRALPALVRQQLGGSQTTAADLTRTLVTRLAVSVGRRTLKVLPGMGAALSAYDARRRISGWGRRMVPVLRRAWDGVLLLEGPVEDAVEVLPGARPRTG